jgi:hypothetical protein
MSGNSLLIYICNFHVLSHLLLIYICKLHWKGLECATAIDADDFLGCMFPSEPRVYRLAGSFSRKYRVVYHDGRTSEEYLWGLDTQYDRDGVNYF